MRRPVGGRCSAVVGLGVEAVHDEGHQICLHANCDRPHAASSRVVVGEDALVEIAALEQLVVRAEVDHSPVAQDQDLVGPADLGEAVGDQERRAVCR